MTLESVLKENALKVTPQRMGILSFLDQKTHPTVDEIYSAVQADFPSVSLATVYKNINKLSESGIIRQINTNSVIRYDLGMVPHGHLVCKRCGSVEDIFEIDPLIGSCTAGIEEKTGVKVEMIDVTAFVCCRSCRMREE